jgi:pilus assembly protein CpaC
MNHVLRASVVLVAVVFVASAARIADAASSVLTVRTGESIVMQTPGLTRVAVGDAKIAGVVPIGTSEIVVNGKSAGHTTLFVWTDSGRVDYVVAVSEQGLDDLRRMLQSAIATPGVRVDEFGETLVVGGAVADGDEALEISNVVARFAPVAASGKYAIVDSVTLAHPLGGMKGLLATNAATAGVTVERDAAGDIVVSGTVPDRTTAQKVLADVKALGGPVLAGDGKVIDRLQTATVSQVDIKVYVLEIDDTGLKNLGIQLQSSTTTAGTSGTSSTYTLGDPIFPFIESIPAVGKAFTVGPFLRTTTLAPTLNLNITSGHTRILSSPDLVTMPGHKAEFLVGGEIPIPVSSGPQQVSIEYKEYGVKLEITPTILGDGDVETVIAPEVSDLDYSDGVTENGFVVPALKTSQLSTDVITKTGESIVMGGLLSRMESRNITKIPLLGDLPILGPLFRSVSYQTSKSDVVFVMTPTILTRRRCAGNCCRSSPSSRSCCWAWPRSGRTSATGVTSNVSRKRRPTAPRSPAPPNSPMPPPTTGPRRPRTMRPRTGSRPARRRPLARSTRRRAAPTTATRRRCRSRSANKSRRSSPPRWDSRRDGSARRRSPCSPRPPPACTP